MREILFKAKRLADGKWIEGYYQKRYDELGKEEHYIFWAQNYNAWAYEQIDPETLCQHIGLTDKNGKKIWEHDIVKHKKAQCFGTVKWDRKDFIGWCVEDVYDEEQQFDEAMFTKCEVIGNVFDNPKLLKVV